MAVATYCSDNIHGMLAPNTVETKPMSSQQRDTGNSAEHRNGTALTGSARGTEIGKGDHNKGNRIQRRHQAIMQLGAELVGLIEIGLIIRAGKQELP